MDSFSRTELLLGADAMKKLRGAHVAVFGIGGVGGYAVEALARSGIGGIDIIDNDKICETNINRQIYATRKTLGLYKVDVAMERIHDIDPNIIVHGYKIFYTPQNADMFDFTLYDYVIDAIDTVSGKISLAEKAEKSGTPIISSMGAGNKLEPTAFETADIYETSVCPLARVMRYELKKRGIKKLKVVYSKEPPVKPVEKAENGGDIGNAICGEAKKEYKTRRGQTPGSVAFVPSVAGLIIAGEVIKDLIA